jgi:hypothetical protein
MGDGVGVASIATQDLIKTRLQGEETKIDFSWGKLVVRSDQLCHQAINLSGETMISLS